MEKNSSKKIKAIKNSLYQIIMYYNQALYEIGCKDIKKEIASEISKAISFTNDQKEFIKNEANYNIANDLIQSIEEFLKNSLTSKTIDYKQLQNVLESVLLLKSILSSFSNQKE